MLKIASKIFFIVLLLSCNETGDKKIIADINHTQVDNFITKIDATINQYLDLDIFSGIVLVADKGTIIYHKAFGLADREEKRPNNINTLFDIGSMNKTFTAIVIKNLIAEGKLSPNDKLIEYIPGFNDSNASKITVQHLLDHKSGFGDYHTPQYFELPKNERKLNNIVERAKSFELNFDPGTEEDYSNLGYVILGAIIEKVTGKSYFENVNEYIVKPLNLKNTFLNDFDGLESRTAKGYYYTPLGELQKNETIQDLPNPDGGFLSTTQDVMKFYRSYYYDDLLLPEDAKENDPTFQFLSQLPKGKATGAAGGFPGFNTALYQVYKDDFTIIVFANMDEPVAEHLALDILELKRGNLPKPPKEPALQSVRKAFEAHGTDFVKKNFEELTTNYHPEDPKDFILNDLGYAYINVADKIDKALQLFKLNTELFPDIANCWDSYGEALVLKGKYSEAIEAYGKALKIEPNLKTSKEALKKLKN